MKKITAIVIAITCSLLILNSCKKDQNNTGTSRVAVMLKDAPALVDKVNLDVKAISILSDKAGWIRIAKDTMFDILQFRDTSLLMGYVSVPYGTITDVKLELGANSTIVIAGITMPLILADADINGIILHINQDVRPGLLDAQLIVDFDAANSIFDDGNHNYHCHPVMHHFWHEHHHHHGGGDDDDDGDD